MTVIESADVAVEEPKPRRRPPKRRPGAWRRALRRDWPLYSLAVAPLIFLAIFRYVPMAGNIIAFRRFHPGGSIYGDERSEEHTSELQSRGHLVCRLLLEKKK